MKQIKIIRAYKATEKLSHNDSFSTDTLWGLYKLRKVLFPHWEFQNERENELKKKYAKYADKNGVLTGEHYNEYLQELSKILDMEKEISNEGKITIPLKEGLGISVEMMEALEDFVDFVKE